MMTKGWRFSYLLSFMLLLSACHSLIGDIRSSKDNHENTEPDHGPVEITGYIMDKEDRSLLIVEPINSKSEGRPRAIWISHVQEDLSIGKQVEVWINGEINGSYPQQAEADQISVVEMSEVEGAELSASEVLAAALSDQSSNSIFSVHMISFEKESDQWVIHLDKVGTGDGKVRKVVPDQ